MQWGGYLKKIVYCVLCLLFKVYSRVGPKGIMHKKIVVALSMYTLIVSMILEKMNLSAEIVSETCHFLFWQGMSPKIAQAMLGGKVCRAALRGLPCCLQQHGLELPSQHCILF